MSNKKGEIATILTISSLVFLGVFSLVSSFFIKKTDKIQSRASSCSQVSLVSYSPSSISVGQTFTCSISGSIVNPYTMACGWSKNGGWPQGQLSGRCGGNSCTFQVKMEDQIDPNATYELVGFDFRSDCGPNIGKKVSLTVAGANLQQSQVVSSVFSGGGNSGVGNGCFNIKAEFEVRQEGDKKAFYSWVTFNSDKGGDIKLEYNGIHVAGWNKFNGGTFTYSPQWTQPHTHDYESGIAGFSGKAYMPFTYRGMHSGCQPQDVTLSCAVGIDDQGPYVSGEGCSCRNCQRQSSSSSSQSSSSFQSSSQSSSSSPTTTSTTPEPGEEGGACLNHYYIRGARLWVGECNGNLICNPANGICVEPTPSSKLIPTQKQQQGQNTSGSDQKQTQTKNATSSSQTSQTTSSPTTYTVSKDIAAEIQTAQTNSNEKCVILQIGNNKVVFCVLISPTPQKE